MPAGHSPMIKRRKLGEELRELRETKGLRLQELAAELGWSHTKLSRLENAKVRPDVADVMDLLEALGTDDDQTAKLITLARQANQRGWWRAYAGMPQRQAGYAELESGVVSIREYALVFVPGLLQTPAYIRQRFSDRDAVREFDVDAAVSGRLERQRILTRDGIRYEAVIDESVLRRRSAEAPVLVEQLHHLLAVGQQPNITIRVLPFTAEVEYLSGALHSFGLYQFADPDDDDMVSVETEASDLWLGDPEDVARYTVVYNRLRAASLDPDQTAALLTELANEKKAPDGIH